MRAHIGIFAVSFILILAFILSSSILSDTTLAACTSQSPCCCQTYQESGQRRCFNSGLCCDIGTTNEFWNPTSCYNFTIDVSYSGFFRIGQKSPISVIITNLGAYTDSYSLTYQIDSINPQFILLETNGATQLNGVARLETAAVKPKVTILSTLASGNILVNITSMTDPRISKLVSILIIGGDLPYSLPEFNFLALIIILGAAGMIYYKKVGA